MDECKPLLYGFDLKESEWLTIETKWRRPMGRGSHSFTLELNLSNSRTRS